MTDSRLRTLWHFFRNRFRPGTAYGLGLTLALIVVGLGFWTFVEVVESWTRQTELDRLDVWFQQLVAEISSPSLTMVMRGATEFGSIWMAIIVVVVVSVVLVRQRKAFMLLALLVAFIAGEGLIYALKLLFHRTRPEDILVAASSASFPSGHAFTAFVVYGFLIYYLQHSPLSSQARIAGTALLLLLIGLVGFSRIYLHAHYFTDVAGGFILGLLWLVTGLTLTRLFYQTATPSPSSQQDG